MSMSPPSTMDDRPIGWEIFSEEGDSSGELTGVTGTTEPKSPPGHLMAFAAMVVMPPPGRFRGYVPHLFASTKLLCSYDCTWPDEK